MSAEQRMRMGQLVAQRTLEVPNHYPLLQCLWIWNLLNIFSTPFQLLSDADGVGYLITCKH